tara:strand:- start:1899 stop:2177 length:279 start_codon:yes stop_codon:yes gene_type:complete
MTGVYRDISPGARPQCVHLWAGFVNALAREQRAYGHILPGGILSFIMLRREFQTKPSQNGRQNQITHKHNERQHRSSPEPKQKRATEVGADE